MSVVIHLIEAFLKEYFDLMFFFKAIKFFSYT